MPKNIRSVHMPMGLAEAIEIDAFARPDYKSVNQYMVRLLQEGTDRHRNPPPPPFVEHDELQRLRLELSELREKHQSLLTSSLDAADHFDKLSAEFSSVRSLLAQRDSAIFFMEEDRTGSLVEKEELEEKLRTLERLTQQRLTSMNLQVYATNAEFARVEDELKLMIQGRDDTVAKLTTEMRRADDHEQRTLELEHQRDKALADRDAAEQLLEGLHIVTLTTELEGTKADLARAKDSINELTVKLGYAERELVTQRTATPAKSGVPQADYDRVLRTAHTMADFMRRALILPGVLHKSLIEHSERAGGSSWRRRGCELLVEVIRNKGVPVSTDWVTDVEVNLPRLPVLPPLKHPAK